MEKVINKKILLLGFTKTTLSDATHRKWSAFLGLSEKSAFSPKVEVNNQYLLLKSGCSEAL